MRRQAKEKKPLCLARSAKELYEHARGSLMKIVGSGNFNPRKITAYKQSTRGQRWNGRQESHDATLTTKRDPHNDSGPAVGRHDQSPNNNTNHSVRNDINKVTWSCRR